MTELKPCPFCGGKAEIIEHDNMPVLAWFGYFPDHYYSVRCSNEHGVALSGFRSIEEAVKYWNRRITDES